MTNQEIMNLPANKNLQFIELNHLGNPTFLKETYEFTKFIVKIVKVQWSKTQSVWAIRIPNYFIGKRHILQMPAKNLKEARQIIEHAKKTGIISHYMIGESVPMGDFMSMK